MELFVIIVGKVIKTDALEDQLEHFEILRGDQAVTGRRRHDGLFSYWFRKPKPRARP
ncbi:hypothetical protein AGR1C_Lc20086 [Agrobacterium fabacearum TT111]|jgi:hypothetical protein|nr:hypothetical protein AGR1C_Lc20086 [Agrobacterium fabacearum TT111]